MFVTVVCVSLTQIVDNAMKLVVIDHCFVDTRERSLYIRGLFSLFSVFSLSDSQLDAVFGCESF